MSTDWDMPAGMGVIHWRGQIVVYQLRDGAVLWARLLGAELLPLDDALRAAILAGRAPADPSADQTV